MNFVTYFLVAYKPNSSDSCRGCVMDEFASAFNSLQTSTRETLVDRLADLLYQNKLTARGEADYEFQLLHNGVLVHDGIDGQPSSYYDRYFDSTTVDEYDEAEAIKMAELDVTVHADVKAIFAEATAEAERLYALKLQSARMAEERKLAEQALRKEAEQRKEYERLQQLFGDTTKQ
jgi:hypothetical protein